MYDLNRFINAHKEMFNVALSEIKKGKKESHWMWFIFPQLKGLGKTDISNYYGIDNIDEAKEYVKNEYLYNNLKDITQAILNIENKTVVEILGFPDCYKLKSSMTLFYLASNDILFKKVLDKYYNGELDNLTIKLLGDNYDKRRKI